MGVSCSENVQKQMIIVPESSCPSPAARNPACSRLPAMSIKIVFPDATNRHYFNGKQSQTPTVHNITDCLPAAVHSAVGAPSTATKMMTPAMYIAVLLSCCS